jgi:hypothetical protein
VSKEKAMSPAVENDVASGAAATRPVFVDESGRRARWCRRLLAAGTLVALVFLVTVAVLGVAFSRSAESDSWAAPDRLTQPTVTAAPAAPAGPAAAPGSRP